MMKFNTAPLLRYFFLCVSLLLASSYSLGSSMQTILGKNDSDQNNYAHITLDNGLMINLVSDPNAERFAAAIAIGAGNYQDPDQHPGIAHLLEHMLFLGTEKYPEAGAYQAFIREHGGSHNAYTSGQETNFYFDVLPDDYPEALDRFAQFFVAPTLDPQYIEREINAVDSEYKAKLDDERRRSNEAKKTLLNPDHPSSRFTVGNLDTLGNIPTAELQQYLRSFYQDYYTPRNMRLTLVANQPLEILAAYARSYFSAINDRPTREQESLPKKFTQTRQLQTFKTNTETSSLKLIFPIPSQVANYASQPARYLSYILGDESNNSLFSDLKQNGWAQALHAGISEDDGKEALFTLSIRLTEDGVEQRDSVVERTFLAIENLKASQINQDYLREIKTLSQLNYAYHDYIPPVRLAQVASSRTLNIPPMSLLESFRIERDATEQEIRPILEALNESNVLVQWQNSKTFPNNWAEQPLNWSTEPLYQGEYANSALKSDWIQHPPSSDRNPTFGLPYINPYIPTDLTLTKETDLTPKPIANHTGFDFWYKKNSQYNKPTGMIFGYLGCSESANARDKLLLQLWARLFTDAMSEQTYQPYTAGLNYQLYAHSNGLTLRSSGYTDKQDEFFEDLVTELLEFRATPERLTIAKQEILKGLNNLDSQPPYALARHYFSQVVTKGSSSTDTLQNHLIDITTEEVNRFIQTHLKRFHFTGYMTGNFEQSNAEGLSSTLQSLLDGRLDKHKYQYIELKSFAAEGRYVYQFNTRSADTTVLYSLVSTQSNDASYKERVYVRMMAQLIGARFYHEFRTEKQYGYIVAVTNQTIERTPAIGFLVQSPNTDIETLISEIERFIVDNKDWGENLSDSEFEQARTAVLAAFTQKPTTLQQDALEEWPHVVEPEHNFTDRQQWIESIETLSKDEFKEFVKTKVEENQSARVVIANQWQDDRNWKPIKID